MKIVDIRIWCRRDFMDNGIAEVDWTKNRYIPYNHGNCFTDLTGDMYIVVAFKQYVGQVDTDVNKVSYFVMI